MKIKFIGNPRAGKENIDKIKRAAMVLMACGAKVHTFITEKRGDAEVLARSALNEGFDRIVVAGGDGTINEVINGVAFHEKDPLQQGCKGSEGIPVAIVPIGVSNVLALEIGIPVDCENASKIAFTGVIKSVPLGLANGRYFSLMAGIGFDAEVVCGLNLGLKRYLGKLTYILEGMKLIINYRPSVVEVITNSGETLKGYAAVVGKSKFYGGSFSMTPEAGIEKNELDLCLFQNGKRQDIIRYVLGVLMGRHIGFKDVLYKKVKEIKITSQGKVPVQVDGDCFGNLPVDISLKPNALRLIFPKGKVTTSNFE